MKKFALIVLALILAGCALAPTAVDEARKRFHEGRGEEALAMLQEAEKANPQDLAVRAEYYRLRELLVAQWLVQAETLRGAGQLDMAEALYQRVQSHEPGNARATAGLEQVAIDRRHRVLVAQAEELARNGSYREAQDLLRP
ncbi:MAG: type and secretion system protein, partial [Burkholderiales bacterium]|nr:type and secretion system protein [Burkholderiales bacterium]